MARRSRNNGAMDPYITRRPSSNRSRCVPQATLTSPDIKKNPVDQAAVNKALTKIHKDYQEKEQNLASSMGPPSNNTECHYAKSFFIEEKKDEDE